MFLFSITSFSQNINLSKNCQDDEFSGSSMGWGNYMLKGYLQSGLGYDKSCEMIKEGLIYIQENACSGIFFTNKSDYQKRNYKQNTKYLDDKWVKTMKPVDLKYFYSIAKKLKCFNSKDLKEHQKKWTRVVELGMMYKWYEER